jgi:hypothetical protein
MVLHFHALLSNFLEVKHAPAAGILPAARILPAAGILSL